MSAANAKIFCARLERLGHAFGDVFAHLAWGADLELARTSTIAVPPYTLTDRRTAGTSRDVWEWQSRGRYRTGTERRDYLRRSETASPHCKPTSSMPCERRTKAGVAALGRPCGRRRVGRTTRRGQGCSTRFPDLHTGQATVRRCWWGEPCRSGAGIRLPGLYWRVRYPDGDWEGLRIYSRKGTRGVKKGRSAKVRGWVSSLAADQERERWIGYGRDVPGCRIPV